jgi:hypothetical protein
MNFDAVSAPAPSNALAGPGFGGGQINWAQLLGNSQQQPQQPDNKNSLGSAIMAWFQQQQKQTTPPPVNMASNFSPNTSGGGVY